MSQTEYIIKCVMCKADFDQECSRSRFCLECRSRKNRTAREKFYSERRERRKGFKI